MSNKKKVKNTNEEAKTHVFDHIVIKEITKDGKIKEILNKRG